MFRTNASSGDTMAHNVMGMAYKYGIGVAQHYSASLNWFRKAAEHGEADAQFNQARIYASRAEQARKFPTVLGETTKANFGRDRTERTKVRPLSMSHT